MKKVSLTILSICVSLCAFCQQLDTNSVAVLQIPNGLVEQQKPKLTTNSTKQAYDVKEKYLKFYSNNPKADTYKGNGVIKFLSVYGTKTATQPDYLENRKKGMDAIATMDGAKKPSGYSTVIKKINNYSVLIIRTERDDYIKFTVFSVNDKHTSVLNSMIIIMKTDRTKAEKTVNELLMGIKFN
jgi:hypothetical protein